MRQLIFSTPPTFTPAVVSATSPSSNVVQAGLVSQAAEPQFGILSYTLQYSTAGNQGPWTTIASSLTPASFPYNWNLALANTEYFIRVLALSKKFGYGVASNVATATTAPIGPSGLAIVIASGTQKGKFVNQLGALIGGSFDACIGPEEPWGYKDGSGRSMRGFGLVTAAQYGTANTTNLNTVAAAARPALATKGLRLLFNSALWMGATGRDPQMPSSPGCMSNNYYPAGTDSAGHPLWSGGPGGGPGSGIGHEQFGDPTQYRTNMLGVIVAGIAAGYFIVLDLHFGTLVLSNGQCVMPAGQTAFPSTLDQACWVSVMTAVNALPNSGMVIPGLFNEIYGTNTGATGIERAYMGSQSLVPFAFPTTATGSPNSSLSNGRGSAAGVTMFDNAGDNNNYAICGGGQTSQSVGFQSMVNALRAIGCTQPICVGNQSYNTQIGSYSAIGGNMVVNDTLSPSQLCIDQHYDTGATWAQFQSLQAAGWGVMSTEMNSISSTNGGYQNWLLNGCLYSFWGGWTDFASGIVNWPPSTNCFLSGVMTGKDQNNVSQTYGGTPWRTASVVPNGSN